MVCVRYILFGTVPNMVFVLCVSFGTVPNLVLGTAHIFGKIAKVPNTTHRGFSNNPGFYHNGWTFSAGLSWFVNFLFLFITIVISFWCFTLIVFSLLIN